MRVRASSPRPASGTRCSFRLAQTGVSVRRNSWPRSRPHWCVRNCGAVSQQDLEEETGCGQADCSIMPGTCKLHDPACHCALSFLMGAALPSEATHKNAQTKLTNARCPDHAICRTRSAHAGAGMLFNVQRSQEFIFCLAENHFHDESSLGLEDCQWTFPATLN